MNFYKILLHNLIRYRSLNPKQYQCLSQFRSFSKSTRRTFYYNNTPFTSVGTLISEKYVQDPANHITADMVLPIRGIDNLTSENRSSLLQSCSNFLPKKSKDMGVEIYDKILREIENFNFHSIKECNAYIQICTENEIGIEYATFLNSLKYEPNEETFKLLLENVCENGDTNQAHEILSKIKQKRYLADERVFNALILAHVINDGYKGAQVVLNTMKAAQIMQSSNTNWCILLGLAVRNNDKEFMEAIETLSFTFNDQFFIKTLMKLSLNDKTELIKIVKNKFDLDILSRPLLPFIKELCIYLIYRNRPNIGIRMYCDFTIQNTKDDYCNVLLKELLKIELEPKEILHVCEYLKDIGKKEQALEFVTGISLANGLSEHAWYFLKHFNELRPHYFWPLLLYSGRKGGESGVIKTLNQVLELNVNINSETLETYIMPFCDISSPKSFLLRVNHLKLSLRHLLTPLLVTLLRNNRTSTASRLCDEYKIHIEASRLAHPLAMAYKSTVEVIDIVNIMKRIYEANETPNVDFIGRVLVLTLKFSRQKEDYDKFLIVLKTLHLENLTISSLSAENLEHILQMKRNCHNKQEIENMLDNLLDVSMNRNDTHISHPRNMTVDELECHLIELTNKNMETRGVLRRLIHAYGKLGNHQRIQQLKCILEKSAYEETPGMKAVRLQTYIKTNQSQLALELFEDIRKRHSSFKIDDFKIIDLAVLLLGENKYETGVSLLKREFANRVVRSNSTIERNCMNLLRAAGNSTKAVAMFELLRDCGLCQPTNIILGAVLKSYLNCNDLEGAVKYYEDCCKLYKRTPLQIELMQNLIDEENENLLTRVINATATVYGSTKAQISLAIAFAEKQKKSALTKLLLNIKHVPNAELQNRCNKLVTDGKLETLLTLAEAASRIPQNVINVYIIHDAIIRLYDSRTDIEGALKFVNNLRENDVIVSQKITNLVNNLVKRSESHIV